MLLKFHPHLSQPVTLSKICSELSYLTCFCLYIAYVVFPGRCLHSIVCMSVPIIIFELMGHLKYWKFIMFVLLLTEFH